MRRYLAIALGLCTVAAGLVAAQASKSAATADDAVVQADRALAAAYAKGDNATVNKLLDADFTWIDTDGIMWERPDVLRAGLKPLVPMTSETKITEHKYGKVVWIQDNVGNKYAAHFWVLRPAGWSLLHVNEIATRPAKPGENERPNFTIPCINPCKEVPYKPLSPSEKAALENWQDQESGTGHHDMHMGDNVVVISSTTGTPRPSKTATGPTPVTPPTAARPFISTTPVLWARTWDFGDSVVAIMLQPTWGGKAYWSSRVFANHNGFWKMEESYHTTIQAAPRMTGVPMTAQQSAE
ncbi:MAG TPA: hypothetical protein VNE63_05595 [Candidatus Acidoferrales bacterium]|nr:hypothetical protein [Candidatus Acidoferrales bacterium]